MRTRLLLVSLMCLAAGGCAMGDGFFGPPFNYVEDAAAASATKRTDGYPSGEPVAIATIPGFPL